VADLAHLVAASVLASAGIVELLRRNAGRPAGYPTGYGLRCLAAPVLLSMAVALLLARFRRPRAELR
jgi:hypothetical protein